MFPIPYPLPSVSFSHINTTYLWSGGKILMNSPWFFWYTLETIWVWTNLHLYYIDFIHHPNWESQLCSYQITRSIMHNSGVNQGFEESLFVDLGAPPTVALSFFRFLFCFLSPQAIKTAAFSFPFTPHRFGIILKRKTL